MRPEKAKYKLQKAIDIFIYKNNNSFLLTQDTLKVIKKLLRVLKKDLSELQPDYDAEYNRLMVETSKELNSLTEEDIYNKIVYYSDRFMVMYRLIFIKLYIEKNLTSS